MKKEIVYKGSIDYAATLNALEEVGQYVVIPTSDNDISNIRAVVSKFQASDAAYGRTFSVHKTINGARIERTL